MKKSNNVWMILTLIMSLITGGLIAFVIFQKTLTHTIVTNNKVNTENTQRESLPKDNKRSIDYSTTRFEDSNISQNLQNESSSVITPQKNSRVKQPNYIPPKVNYNFPQIEQPKPRFTFDELRSQLQGKGEFQVLNIIGRPSSVFDSGESKYWYYEYIAYDSTTGNISRRTQINFECGKYSSDESLNRALESGIKLEKSRGKEVTLPKICFVRNINF